MMREYTAKEEGYVYMYVSNENATLVDVYFDDVVMTYTKSNIVQYNEYYPFGLQTQNSWTRENVTGNNFLYNGGSELNTTTAVYDLFFRNYDPALGRMNQVDPMAAKYASLTPYNYALNNPVRLNDPLGDDVEPQREYREYYCGSCWRDGESAMLYMRASGYGGSMYGMGAGWRPSGSGWVAQIGNLRIDYNSLSDGIHTFGFSGGEVNYYSPGGQDRALAFGILYNDHYESWQYTSYGSEATTVIAYTFAGKNGGVLPSRTQVNYWVNNYVKIKKAYYSQLPVVFASAGAPAAWMFGPQTQGHPGAPDSKFYYDAIDGMVLNNGTVLSRNDVILTFYKATGNATYLGFKNGKHHVNFDIEDFEITKGNVRALVIHEIFGHGIMGYSYKTNDHYKAYWASIDSRYWSSTTDQYRTHTAEGLWLTWTQAGNYQGMPTKYMNIIYQYHPAYK
jgi:RHS repeat-associated protein